MIQILLTADDKRNARAAREKSLAENRHASEPMMQGVERAALGRAAFARFLIAAGIEHEVHPDECPRGFKIKVGTGSKIVLVRTGKEHGVQLSDSMRKAALDLNAIIAAAYIEGGSDWVQIDGWCEAKDTRLDMQRSQTYGNSFTPAYWCGHDKLRKFKQDPLTVTE